jgi:hypothetical protein
MLEEKIWAWGWAIDAKKHAKLIDKGLAEIAQA